MGRYQSSKTILAQYIKVSWDFYKKVGLSWESRSRRALTRVSREALSHTRVWWDSYKTVMWFSRVSGNFTTPSARVLWECHKSIMGLWWDVTTEKYHETILKKSFMRLLARFLKNMSLSREFQESQCLMRLSCESSRGDADESEASMRVSWDFVTYLRLSYTFWLTNVPQTSSQDTCQAYRTELCGTPRHAPSK